MPVAAWSALFAAGVAVSLATSWVLVTRLERLGERAGISEALLGVLAALAADAPEITAAVVALAHGQASVGAGVVIGSNVFNLAALLGLAAVVAGQIALHRRVVLLSGGVGASIASICLLVVLGVLMPPASLLAIAAALVPYLIVLGMRPRQLARLPVSRPWTRWLTTAIREQETELEEAIHPRRGSWRDAVIVAAALLVVVAASTVMERAATTLGGHFGVAGIVTGGLVLAVVTSFPNAVAAIYLALRGRGAAALSTALNSNAINVAVGLLLPATIIGLGPRTGPGTLVAAWYAGLAILAVILASAAMPSPHLIKPAHHKARYGSARAGPVPYRATAFSFPRTGASPTTLPTSFRPWTTSAAQRAALLFACSAAPEPGSRPHPRRLSRTR